MDSFRTPYTQIRFFREFSLAIILIMVTFISYVILSGALNPMYTLASTFVTGSSQDALDFTMVAFGSGFVLLAFGLLAWGVGSAVRRGEDTARF